MVMAYSKPGFTFNPSNNSSFDPSSPTNSSKETNPFGIEANPYVPTCDSQTSLAKQVHMDQYNHYVKNYGQRIAYQSTRYNMNTHNFLYGEDPTSGYHYARYMKAIIDFASYTTFLTKFGTMSNSDIVIYIPITHFQEIWGTEVNPMKGDIFFIVDSACDRPLKQTPMVFEVTEKHDSINAVDFMGGHYVWKLDANRFDMSHEPNATEEAFLGGVNDSKDTEEYEKPYTQNVDDAAKEDFDNKESSVYGKFL